MELYQINQVSGNLRRMPSNMKVQIVIMSDWSFPGPGKGFSLHNHSVFSDGASMLEEMVSAAKNAGLAVFGMSDHWVDPPYDGTDYLTWSMPHDKLPEYVETLLKLREQYEDENFKLKIGLEVDFFFENAEKVVKYLREYPLDYLIGSVHYAGVFSVDYDISDWIGLSEKEIGDICSIYWQKVAGAADCGYFDFIGHLDLPKKFGMIDNSKYFQNAVDVLDIIQKRSGAIEVNTAGWFKQCNEPYPSLPILKEACKRNIPVAVNADAHCSEHVNRHFQQGYALLKEAGYNF